MSNNAIVNQVGQFDINTPYVRDAILYYTIQQYFNNNEKKHVTLLKKLNNFILFIFEQD